MTERHFGNDLKHKWYFNSEMSCNGLLSGSTSSNYKTRKDWCAMHEQKILGYILFSSHKWENIPENKCHPYKHGI